MPSKKPSSPPTAAPAGRKAGRAIKAGDKVVVGGDRLPGRKAAPAKKVPAKKVPAKKAAPKKAPSKPLPKESRLKPENAERLAGWQKWRESKGAIEELCQWIGEGDHTHSLNAWCIERNWNWTTVAKWIEADADRSTLYRHACEQRGWVMFEAVITTAHEAVSKGEKGMDSAAVADKRLRVDTLKWAAGRLNSKFTDKLQVGGSDDMPPVKHAVSGELTMSPSEAYLRMIGK